MKRAVVLIFLLFLSYYGFAQYPYRYRTSETNKYNVALTMSNPLSSMSKSGFGVEHRYGNFSYMAYLTLYRGAYPGIAEDLDLHFYFKKRWKVTRNSKWTYQDYIYWRGYYGIAAFDSKKIEMLGYPKDVTWDFEFYYGTAAGYGRRFNRGPFFVSVRVGMRGTLFLSTDENDNLINHLSEEAKPIYKLFYATGPGSIVECNMQFGVQLF